MVIRGRGSLQPSIPAEMLRLERLNGVLPNRVLEVVEHFSGLSDAQLMTLLDVRAGRLADAVKQLNRGEDERAVATAVARFKEATGENEDRDRDKIGALLKEANCGELLVRIPVYTGPEDVLTSNVALLEGQPLPPPEFVMNYCSSEATIIIEHRDVSSLAVNRRRINEDIRKDHNVYAPQLLHTLQQNECIVNLVKGGYRVSAGYRGCLYLPGGQLVPDSRMSAYLDLGEYPTEVIRGSWWPAESQSARAAREGIRRQLIQYVSDARRLGGLTIACLCENDQVMELAREAAIDISRAYQAELEVFTALGRDVVTAPSARGVPHPFRRLLKLLRFYVEYERSATTSYDIREKLMTYFRVVLRGYQCAVICICETRAAADIFRQEHRILQRARGSVSAHHIHLRRGGRRRVRDVLESERDARETGK